MDQKTKHSKSVDLDDFKNQYWLKTELVNFCRQNNLSALGSKQELAQRIEVFIATGAKLKPSTTTRVSSRDSNTPISMTTFVVNYKNDAATRLFFVEHIGEHFRFDAYLRQFTNKNNITKDLTYSDLVDGWLAEEMKRNEPHFKSDISKQFEYNQFTRDFFANENGKSLADAIKAWNVVKTLPGMKTYANYKSTILERKKS
jgi:hypothetical protein